MRWVLIALLTIFLVGGYNVFAKNSNSFPSLQPLPLTDRINKESIIGIFPFSEAQTTAAINLPSIDSLLKGVGLMVSSIDGEEITDPDLAKRISDELGHLLGGWFAQDLTPYIKLHKSLVSDDVQDSYRRGGMTITWDEPKTAFYYMAFEVPPWQVQAVGEVGVFHSVSIGRSLSQTEAIREGGHPAVHPVGSIEPLLAQATPKLLLKEFSDHSADHATNVFDTYLQRPGLTIKSGVRQRLVDGKAEISSGQPYHYGIRINLDLRSSQ
ncbi:MAG: hypothetical protein RIE73_17085 [Coleofasciculus sp. C1-SOL-03]|jgi:hypothetical protein|uniref:hypothetical protein n=1 Tax=Coleofasciculus sp. C1-SOL-03 TaxID=3069522 RepID=UPI003302F949